MNKKTTNKNLGKSLSLIKANNSVKSGPLLKVTNSNLKNFSGKFQLLFSFGAVFFLTSFFLGVSFVMDKPFSVLPQTGDDISLSLVDRFSNCYYI